MRLPDSREREPDSRPNAKAPATVTHELSPLCNEACGPLHPVEIGADDEPAREILARLLRASRGTQLARRLLYDPGLQHYFFDMAIVEVN